MRSAAADDLSDFEPLKHVHQCPWCHEDRVCTEGCSTELDEGQFIERGAYIACDEAWCVEQEKCQKAMDLLASEPDDLTGFRRLSHPTLISPRQGFLIKAVVQPMRQK